MDQFTKGEEAEYEVFCEAHGHFMQSIRWGLVKEGWTAVPLTARDAQGSLTGTMLVLVRDFPLLHTAFLYAPRGPVCDPKNAAALQVLAAKARLLAEEHHAFALRIDPPFFAEDTEAVSALTAQGFSWAPERVGYDTIQSRENYMITLDGRTPDELLKSFSAKCRYNIRLASRKGVICGMFGEEKLDDFMKLMDVTAARDGFAARDRVYFSRLLRSFGTRAGLCMCYLDGEPLSGALWIEYAGRMSYLYGCSSAEHRDCMPNYLMQWTMIGHACRKGDAVYDFCGVPYWYDPQHKNYGVFRFKAGFRGEVRAYAGEFDMTFRPVMARLFEALWKCRRYLSERRGAGCRRGTYARTEASAVTGTCREAAAVTDARHGPGDAKDASLERKEIHEPHSDSGGRSEHCPDDRDHGHDGGAHLRDGCGRACGGGEGLVRAV